MQFFFFKLLPLQGRKCVSELNFGVNLGNCVRKIALHHFFADFYDNYAFHNFYVHFIRYIAFFSKCFSIRQQRSQKYCYVCSILYINRRMVSFCMLIDSDSRKSAKFLQRKGWIIAEQKRPLKTWKYTYLVGESITD